MNSWQQYVKDHKGPGVTLKSLASKYRQQKGGQQAGQKGGQSADLKISSKVQCNGDCAKHVDQLNVYVRYLNKTLSEDVLKADKISDAAQVVIFSNVLLLNLVTYYFDNYGLDKKLTETDIKAALLFGNNNANKPDALKFRTSFFKWMGSEDYAELLNSIDLGCAVESIADMKGDYIIKVACLAYGLQLMFAETDLQEVSNYMDASWFNDFIKTFRRSTTSVSDACKGRVSATRKGLNMLSSVASATGKAAIYAAPFLAKAAVATGKGVIYAAPVAGKVAWYTGEKAFYTGSAVAKTVNKIPGVSTALELTGAIIQLLGAIATPTSALDIVFGHN
jgi:hypothetical protein